MDVKRDGFRLRNHFSYVIEQMWGALVVLFFLMLGNTETIELGKEMIREGNIFLGLLIAGGAFLLLLFICLWHILRWYKTTITIQDGAVIYERRTWNRRVNHIAVVNISNINLEQNLFERIVGTCKVKLDTSSLSTANKTDLQIVLKKRDAEWMKRTLVQMIQEVSDEKNAAVVPGAGAQAGSGMTAVPGAGAQEGSGMTAVPGAGAQEGSGMTAVPGAGAQEGSGMTAVPGVGAQEGSGMTVVPGVSVQAESGMTHGMEMPDNRIGLNPALENHLSLDDDNMEFDIQYSAFEIIRNTFLSTSILSWLVIIGGIIFCSIGDITLFLGEEAADLGAVLGAWLVWILLISSFAWEIVKRALADFRFRARRDTDKIYVSCGLLKKKKYTVPVNKINAVTLHYTLLGRLFRKASIKVINIGGEGEDVDGMKFLLSDSYSELTRKMKILLPEYQLPELKRLKRPPFKSFLLSCAVSLLIGGCFLLVLQAGIGLLPGVMTAEEQGQAMQWAYLCAGAVIFIKVCLSFLSYRAAGIYHGEQMVLSRGIFSRVVLSIPYERIQYVHTEQSPLQKLLHLNRGYIKILASAFSNEQMIGVFEEEQYSVLAEKLRQTY